jgi:hypothetical protein
MSYLYLPIYNAVHRVSCSSAGIVEQSMGPGTELGCHTGLQGYIGWRTDPLESIPLLGIDYWAALTWTTRYPQTKIAPQTGYMFCMTHTLYCSHGKTGCTFLNCVGKRTFKFSRIF